MCEEQVWRWGLVLIFCAFGFRCTDLFDLEIRLENSLQRADPGVLACCEVMRMEVTQVT